MPFTQIIELDGVQDEEALHEHAARWDAEQAGVAPGYLGSRVFADDDAADRYLVVVDFASKAEAARNNDRSETAAWAATTRALAGGEPAFRNLREVYTTYR